MTVSRLRTELSDQELVVFAAYYDLKGERAQSEIDKSKRRR